ncbi:MAG: hypothetical protein ABSB68_08130 [Acidimicrobiales bacterium]|jgi:hypothetical protein
MIQARAVHTQADAHRQELMAGAGTRRAARRPVAAMSDSGETQRSATGRPVAGGRAMRRAVAPRVGSWLIGFGTRLGGASVRTS